jgi:hypothetical protein
MSEPPLSAQRVNLHAAFFRARIGASAVDGKATKPDDRKLTKPQIAVFGGLRPRDATSERHLME